MVVPKMNPPKFMCPSKTKESDYTVEQLNHVFSIEKSRTPISATSGVKRVAFLEFITGILVHTYLIIYGFSFPYSQLLHERDGAALGIAAASAILRPYSVILLSIGIKINKQWTAVPYLLIQLPLIYAESYVLLSVLIRSSNVAEKGAAMSVYIVVLFILQWIEYVKWRIVYQFFDPPVKYSSLRFAEIIGSEHFISVTENEKRSNFNEKCLAKNLSPQHITK